MSWFGAPAGLWALLALPTLVALHLFRRRHREQEVSALFLWEDAGQTAYAGPRRRPWRQNASLWLESAAALAAALYLADFRPFGPGEAARAVLVLDDSASMSAAEAAPGGYDTRRAALAAAEARIAAVGRRGRVTLVRSGAQPSLLAGPDALPQEARAALAAWRPAAPDHPLSAAVALARELAGEGGVTLITDALTTAADFGPETEVVAVGRAMPNAGFVAAERVPATDDEDELRFTVRNFSTEPARRRLRVTAEGGELHARDLDLEAGAAARFTLSVPRGAPTVILSLDADALTLDDHASLPPPPRRPVRVRLDLEEVETRHLLLERMFEALPEVLAAAADEPADLVIGHEPAPAPAWTLLLPRDAGALEAYAGPFAAERRWPLLEGVALDGVLWTRDAAFAMPGLVRVAVGEVPLLCDSGEAAPILRLNLVAARSTLQRTPDWPIFLANLVEAVRAGLPGPRATAVACGQAFIYRADAPTELRLRGPGVERAWRGATELDLDDLPPADAYRLLGPEGERALFAVNFLDAAESDLSQRAAGNRGGAAEAFGVARTDSPLRLVLLAVCAAALAANATLLARRREA